MYTCSCVITDKRHIKKQRSIACNDALEKIGDLKAFACVGNHNSPLSNSPKQRQREREREFESVRERESQRERSVLAHVLISILNMRYTWAKKD